MFKKFAQTFAVCLCASLIAVGCASMKKVSDEELVQTTLNNVKAALEKKDIDALMATFSEDFEHPQVGDKTAARGLLEQGLNSGYADNGEVRIDQIQLSFSDDKKTVKAYPMDLTSSAGSVAVELVMAKEDKGWFVTTVNVDGI